MRVLIGSLNVGTTYEVIEGGGSVNFLFNVQGTLLTEVRGSRTTSVPKHGVRHSPVMYGKLVALQRETRRRSARGALRADSLRLERHSRVRMFIRRPDILWLPLRRLECES
jgi:hypothetical protein